MQPLAYAAIFAGALLLITGFTGSSVASVAKGLPDRTRATVGGAPAAGEGVTGAGETAPAPAGAGNGILHAASSQLGVPYKWGGELARVEFDCSGLVQWAFGQAGVKLPRTAAQQYAATQRVAPDEALPGDLVFFGRGREVTHVGIVVRRGLMIDAPHTGAVVRYESFPERIGSAWGSERLIGYGRA